MLLFLLYIFSVLASGNDTSDLFQNCGLTKGCFFIPPGCESASNKTCTGIFTWQVEKDGINFVLAGISVFSNLNFYDYVAVGFSLDEYMGDDTVLACIGGVNMHNSSSDLEEGIAMVAWNDKTSNYILYEATELINSLGNFSIVNGRMQCEGKWKFSGWDQISQNQERTYDLSNPNLQFHILFVRGIADKYTYSLMMHTILDGEAFPWISQNTISFCSTFGCGGNLTTYKNLDAVHQSAIPRFVKHSIGVAHGITMIVCWWVLIASSILIARFGKKYKYEICGSAIWFQLHRFMMLISFLCITAAFFLIYWQAGFRVFTCATICDLESYTKQVHSLLGTVTYSFLILQILMGILRPGKDSPLRPYFNWLHTFNGLLIWSGASTCCVLGVSLGKTGLRTFYGNYPYLLMTVLIMIFIVIFAICEWHTNRIRFIPKNSDSAENEIHEVDKPSIVTTLLIGLNAGWGITGSIILGIWLMSAMRKYGFQV